MQEEDMATKDGEYVTIPRGWQWTPKGFVFIGEEEAPTAKGARQDSNHWMWDPGNQVAMKEAMDMDTKDGGAEDLKFNMAPTRNVRQNPGWLNPSWDSSPEGDIKAELDRVRGDLARANNRLQDVSRDVISLREQLQTSRNRVRTLRKEVKKYNDLHVRDLHTMEALRKENADLQERFSKVLSRDLEMDSLKGNVAALARLLIESSPIGNTRDYQLARRIYEKGGYRG